MRGRIALAGIAVAAVVAWALLGTGGGGREVDPDAEGRGGTTEAAPPERPALAPGTRVEPAATAGTPAAAGGEIHGVVRRRGAGEVADVAVFGVPASEGAAVPVERLLGPLLDPEARPLASAESGADGTFAVAGLAPGTYAVYATAADGAAARALATLRASGDRARVECVIRDPGLTLRGRAVDRVGKPWRGVVAVGPLDDEVDVLLREASAGRTAEDGTFALDVPEAGTHALVALDGGGVAAVRLVSVPSRDEVELRVEPGFFHRPGRVVTDVGERPVAGARLEAIDVRTKVVLARTTSDDEGRFLLFVPPGEVVRATAPGFASAVDRVWYSIDVGAGLQRLATRLFGGKEEKPEEIVLRLSVGATVSGHVRAPDGTPVGGVTVTVLPHSSDVPTPTDRLAARTAESALDGGYEISGAPPGGVLMAAGGNGWVTQSPGGAGSYAGFLAESLDAARANVVDFTVLRTGTLAGRVVDEGGHPVTGAVVELTDGRSGSVFYQQIEAGRETITDAKGTFGFVRIEPDVTYVVRATRPDDPLVAGEGAVVGRADATVAVEVVLRRGRRLTVVVTAKEDGRPLADAAVRVSPTQEGLAAIVRTDASGRTVFEPLSSVAREVVAEARGRLSLRVAVPASPTDTLTLALVQGVPARGRVTRPDGRAAGGARVQCYTPTTQGSTKADAEGRFAVEGQAPGVVEVRAELEGLVGIARGTTSDEVEVRLREPIPVLSVPVRVIGLDGAEASSAETTMLSGFYSAAEVVDGQAVIAAGSWILARDGDGVALEGPFRGTEREVVLRLARGLWVEGVVRDETGRPIPGTALAVRLGADGDRGGVEVARATSAADGTFRLGPFPAGNLAIQPEGPPGTAHVEPVVVRAGATGVGIVLPRGRVVRGVVVDASGAPAPRARAWLAPGTRGWDSWEPVAVDAAGRFRVDRAPVGPFAMRTGHEHTSWGEAAASEVTVPAGVEAVTLTLPSTAPLVVRVVGLGASEQPTAYLAAEGEGDGAVRSVQPMGDLFRFDDLAVGTYSLWVGPLEGSRYAFARGLRPGTAEQRVTVVTGGAARGRLVGFDPEQRAFARIWGPEVFAWAFVDGEGRFAVDGLPPGEWTVQAFQYGKDPDTHGEGRVSTGGEVEIELRTR